MVHLGFVVRFFDYRQLFVSGARKCLIGVHLCTFEVLHAARVVGVNQQVAVHHVLVYRVVDMGFVFRPACGEVPVTWAEDVPFAQVDG